MRHHVFSLAVAAASLALAMGCKNRDVPPPTEPPSGLTYSTNPAVYTKGIAIAPNTPSSSGGAVVSYAVTPALPAGLVLDTSAGVISGTPAAVAATADYTVTASNSAGSTAVAVSITVEENVSCTSDVPIGAGLLTSPPTDIANVGGIVPLGNMNPGGNHVLPVDHMYIVYPETGHAPGTDIYPVYAMAAGKIYQLYRQQEYGRPDYDYEIYIDHTCSVTSRVDHLHTLSARIRDYLTTAGAQWQDMFGSGTGPWIIALGQPGGAAMLDVAAGEQLGNTKNYSRSWDVGIVDKRFVNGTFANTSYTRYPMISDYLAQLPNVTADATIYDFVGQQAIYAGCFIEYLSTAGGLQASWFDLLLSSPRGCGRVGWDTPGYLRGAWFNPTIDGPSWPAFDIDVAALSIVPDNLNPDARVQIGWGNASTSSSAANSSLALLDPSQWDPPIMGQWQIAQPFNVLVDATPGTTVNPDPSAVGAETTVCYDLPHRSCQDCGSTYDYVLFRLTDATHLSVKYVPGEYASGPCTTVAESFPAVDDTWATYIR